MPARRRRQATVDRLVHLINELEPFLNQFGAAYCRMPHTVPTKRMVVPLQSQGLRDLLFYRHRMRHRTRPNWKQIRQAIAEVRGKLLESWEGTSITDESPTLEMMVHAAGIVESWFGSAGDLRELLTNLALAPGLHFDAQDGIPDSDDAMGIWMRDNFATLLSHGIRVWRPKRCRQKRLWAWKKVTPGTGDTPCNDVSPNVSRRNPNTDNGQRPIDTCDTFTKEEQELQNLLNGGGNP